MSVLTRSARSRCGLVLAHVYLPQIFNDWEEEFEELPPFNRHYYVQRADPASLWHTKHSCVPLRVAARAMLQRLTSPPRAPHSPPPWCWPS